MSRPKRRWHEGPAEDRRYEVIEKKIDLYHRPNEGWLVCPCHGRLYVWPSWQGQLKRRRR